MGQKTGETWRRMITERFLANERTYRGTSETRQPPSPARRCVSEAAPSKTILCPASLTRRQKSVSSKRAAPAPRRSSNPPTWFSTPFHAEKLHPLTWSTLEETLHVKTTADSGRHPVEASRVHSGPFRTLEEPLSSMIRPPDQSHSISAQRLEVGTHKSLGHFHIIVHVHDRLMPGVHPSVVSGHRKATERDVAIGHDSEGGPARVLRSTGSCSTDWSTSQDLQWAVVLREQILSPLRRAPHPVQGGHHHRHALTHRRAPLVARAPPRRRRAYCCQVNPLSTRFRANSPISRMSTGDVN